MSETAVRRADTDPRGRPAAGLSPEATRRAADTALQDARDARAHRRLTGGTVAALEAAGFARHFVPQRWGGSEGTFSEVFRAAVTVGEGCASAAWCAVLWAAHARFAALLPEQGQKEIWGAGPDVRIAAAIVPPAGSSVRVTGGRLLHGEWSLASGIDHADWVLLAAPETDAPGRPARVFAVPKSAVRVHDTWNSTGLRATGSNTVSLAETVVPDSRSAPLAALLNGDGQEGLARCYSAPAHLAGGLMFCAPALGAARRALATWNEWARTAAPGGARPLDRPSVQERLVRSAAEIEAVELMLCEAARRADGDPVTAEAVARNQRDAAVAVDWLAAAVDRLFRTGGAHVRDADGDLHRHWADVLTVASHGALRLEPAAEAYARSLGGSGADDA
ncbi:acyl-CoA dehydrogenase family protein [Streptomyces formicae]|uniref:Oxidoreductase n=1 Tax=Streptomyces formicae TaxID=1616117 RepID=A0ABY3WGY6_9ACTN|nr:acyl-CoA dehydrogenase family protein [Streptomyces formicae]UNM11852.1 oxidoreductase [Streptomyces formicae]